MKKKVVFFPLLLDRNSWNSWNKKSQIHETPEITQMAYCVESSNCSNFYTPQNLFFTKFTLYENNPRRPLRSLFIHIGRFFIISFFILNNGVAIGKAPLL